MRSEQSKNPALKSVKGGNAPLPLHASARIAMRTALAVVLVSLSVWVAFDFLPALGWAVVLALALWPLYARFARLLPARWPPVIAPLAFTVLTGVLLFVPIAIAIHEISREASEIIGWIARLRDTGIAVPGWVAQLPVASEFAVEWWRKNLSDPRAAGAWFPDADSVSGWMTAFGGQLLHRIFMFFIALTALYELLRHGPWIGERALGTADRILGDPGERLASRMVEAVRGTVNGTVLVAVAEGLLIGIGYFAAGIPNPLMFTLLTIACAMIPLGAWLAFTAAAFLLVFHGGSQWVAGAVVGWGAAVMLVGDYVLWPTLVGGAARLPFLVAVVGIFGGLQVFGLLGIFLGPVIMAALLVVWREWLASGRR
jgi:predicted PurR-regulated permease PerM